MRKPIKYLPYDKLEKSVKFYFACTISLSVTLMVVAWYANGLRENNIKKNKEVTELKKYKCAWEDFNKTHMPETCLQRLPEIEDIYNERN